MKIIVKVRQSDLTTLISSIIFDAVNIAYENDKNKEYFNGEGKND